MPILVAMRFTASSWFLCVMLPLSAVAQNLPDSGVTRPELAQRIVRIFDFEERTLHPLDIPRHWSRAQGMTVLPGSQQADPRPGFPPFNRAELDYTVAHRGEGSVKLPVLTGSASLRLNPGVLPIFASADYQVSARIMTRGLVGARAGLVARFLDREGQPIHESESRSEFITSERTWSLVRVVMPGEYPDAASLQIELEVLQPSQRGAWMVDPAMTTSAVIRDDVNGVAWFDDVAIVQLPRIEFTTNDPANIIVAPATPGLVLRVRDLTGEKLGAGVLVQDAAGREISHVTTEIGQGQSSVELHPPLPGFGWYRAVLQLTNESVVVASGYVDFLYLPPWESSQGHGAEGHGLVHAQDVDRFGLILSELPRGQELVLPDLVHALRQRWVILPIWSNTTTPATAARDVQRLAPAIERLSRHWIDVVLSVDRVPDDLGRRLAGTTRTLFESTVAAPEDLARLLDPFLDKFGQNVEQWQVGRIDGSSTFWEPLVDERLAAFEGIISRLVPGPLLGLAWRIDYGATPGIRRARASLDAIVLHIPGETLPSAIPDAVRAWVEDGIMGEGPGRASVTVSIESLPSDVYGRQASADDLVKRLVHLWSVVGELEGEQGARARIGLMQPWTWTGQRRLQTMPEGSLAAWRNAIPHLAGRRVTQRIHIMPGVECLVLTPAPETPHSRGSALAVWAEGPSEQSPELTLFLGLDEVRVHDVFGNTRSLAMIEAEPGSDEPPMYRLPVTDSPVFIEGVDAELIAFLASLRLTPAFLRSQEMDHEVQLTFRNPWPTALAGRASIVSPGGAGRDGTLDRSWSIVPRTLEMYAAAGEEQSIAFRIGFSAANEAGLHELVLDLDVASTRPYRRIRASIPFEIGVEHMRADVTHRFAGASPPYDVIVETRIVNLGDEPLTLEVAGYAPGFRRQMASIGTLQPGQAATRHLIFPRASEILRGQSVAVRVEDLDSHARITKAIDID